ncbi:MAG TPA: Nif11-like leader peptide family RiPP precursor [Aggregatilineales bacterium]|nr:Nif11-like leader peptide family RiPP precursor [Aggregatilineales bacterium]
MSKQAILAFGDKVMVDKTLHDKVKRVTPNDSHELIRIASEAGFDFNADELMDVIRAEKAGELSDAELSQVAGGVQGNFTPIHFLASYFVVIQGG